MGKIIVIGLIIILVVLLITFFIEFCNSKPYPDNGTLRIAQLANGKYILQEYKWYLDDWDRAEGLIYTYYNTIEEADKRLNEILAERKEAEGYKIEREVMRTNK